MDPIKCKHCLGYENCQWRDETDDSCWYEPDDYDGHDIGFAIYEEIKRQNGE